MVHFSVSRAWVEFVSLSLDLRWKGGFDNVKLTVSPYFSGIMVHSVRDDVLAANYEDELHSDEDPLAWVAPEPRCCTPKFALPFFIEDITPGFLGYSSWLRNRPDRFSSVAVNQQLGFLAILKRK